MNRLIVCTLLLGCLFISNAQTRYSFKAGKSFKGNQNSQVELTQEVQGMKMSMVTDFDIIYDLNIHEVNGDLAKIEVSYDYMSMNMDMDMMGTRTVIFVDSKDTPEMTEMNDVHSMFKDLMNIPFYFKMKNNGEILEMKGMEELNDLIRSSTSLENFKMLEDALEPDRLKADFARFFLEFPDKPISEDSSWKNPVFIPDLDLLEAEQLWTVNSINPANNLMEVAGNIPSVSFTRSENNVSMNLSGDLSTVVHADSNNGWPNKISVTSNLSGEASTTHESLGDVSWPVVMKVLSVTEFVYE